LFIVIIMNKLVVLFVALASCAFAETKMLLPKELDCAFYANITAIYSSTMAAGGFFMGMQKGDELYTRVDIVMEGGITLSSTITRCDMKDNEGKCLEHTETMGKCSEKYVLGINNIDAAFYYDSEEEQPCPLDPSKNCTRYCNSTQFDCIILDADRSMVAMDYIDENENMTRYELIYTWHKDLPSSFSSAQFAFDKCNNGGKASRPHNPCFDEPTSSSTTPAPSSTAPSESQSSSSSMVKAWFVAVLAALLVALF